MAVMIPTAIWLLAVLTVVVPAGAARGPLPRSSRKLAGYSEPPAGGECALVAVSGTTARCVAMQQQVICQVGCLLLECTLFNVGSFVAAYRLVAVNAASWPAF